MFTAFGFPAQPYERILFCQGELFVRASRRRPALDFSMMKLPKWQFNILYSLYMAFLAPRYLFIGVSCATVSVLSENV